MAIDGDLLVGFRSEADGTVRVVADAVVGDFTEVAFKRRKQTSDALCIVPDMSAGSRAASDTFPGPESAIGIILTRENFARLK